MPGFKSDHINLIADNLRDRYKSGLPVLKELIQNADDAKATNLVFGLHSGFSTTFPHPLLQGSALWVFNDGVFKESDKRAIQSFGLNSKSGETGAIGKFGLGMKSVFHLCEAFFYIAFDGRQVHRVILNPWYDPEGEDAFHNHWEDVSLEEFESMQEVVRDRISKSANQSWFLLWIPLRKKSHVPERDGRPYGAIVDRYPGDSAVQELAFLEDANLARRIGTMLPQLMHLQSVEFTATTNSAGFTTRLVLDDNAVRVDHQTASLISCGSIDDGRPIRERLNFHIHQKALVSNEPFHRFRTLPAWPKTMRQNAQGDREQVPDKSNAEGAVMIAHADGAVGMLTIQWAVFLPTEEGIHDYTYQIENSSRHYQIVLHGQFFVDAGRRGIAGFRHLADSQIAPTHELDDADLHTGWNQAIAQQLVLPELIPTLCRYAERHLSDAETEQLTRAICSVHGKDAGREKRGEFFATFRHLLTQRYAWVRQLTPQGPHWVAIDRKRGQRLLQLPAPPKADPARPWLVFPQLAKATDAIYCDASAPALVPHFDDWDEAAVLAMLEVDHDYAFGKEIGVRYLVEFLEMERHRCIELGAVQRKLVQLLQTTLRLQGVQPLRSIKVAIQSLLALIKPEYRVSIGTKKANALTALNTSTLGLLMECDTEMLLLPSDLDPPANPSVTQANDRDIGLWITALDRSIAHHVAITDEQRDERPVKQLLNAAEQVLELCGAKSESKARMLRLHSMARILTATNARTGKEHPISYRNLQDAHNQRLLFKQGFGSEKLGHAWRLAKTLVENDVWVVSADIARYLEDGQATRIPQVDDKTAILESLGHASRAKKLGAFTERRNLLQHVHELGTSRDARRGLRYLLHASAAHFLDDETILWIEPGQNNSPWVKLWRSIEPDCWNVLDSDLASFLPPSQWSQCGINPVRAESVIKKLSAITDFTFLDGTAFSPDERSAILGHIMDGDLWRRLPLHIDTNGRLDAIDDQCYLASSQKISDCFAQRCRTIVVADSADHRQKQEAWIPKWGNTCAIQLALADEQPGRHWQLILASMHALPAHTLAEIPGLATVCWVPLANATWICPKDVIDLEPLSEDIDRISAECNYCYAGVSTIAPEARTHHGFSMLRPLFAQSTNALERLAQMMGMTPKFAVGEIGMLTLEELRDLLPVLAQIEPLCAWRAVATVAEVYGLEDARHHLLPGLAQQALPLDQLTQILTAIAEFGNSDATEKAFNLYLRLWAAHPDVTKANLNDIPLRSQAGTWRPASQLCHGAAGIAQAWQLDSVQATMLANLIASNTDLIDRLELDDASAALTPHGDSVALLEHYFRPWAELTQPGPVGAFLALLGKPVRGMAEKWLSPHSFHWFADHLGWQDPGRRRDGALDWMGGLSVFTALDKLQPIVRLVEGDSVELTTLTGDVATVELAAEVETILAGALCWKGGYSVEIPLRQLSNLAEQSADQLSRLLHQSCMFLLRDAYNQKRPTLGLVWDKLERSEQLSLAIARDLILENLSYSLKQLKVAKKSPLLGAALAALQQHQQAKSEAAASGKPTSGIEAKIDQAKKELGVLLVENEEVQRVVLEAVRHRVRQNQYEVSSIAFELFQNADDAVAELQMLQRDAGYAPLSEDSVGLFVIESTDAGMRFLHWGRPINHAGKSSTADPTFQYDLEKMLILAGSDKDESTTTTTGKFGLGFKSVLLATDMPCVLSGDLKFRVIAGCLPEPWRNAHGAVDAVQRHRPKEGARLRATVIELPIADAAERAAILERLHALAGIQAIFGKSIHAIHAEGTRYEWRQPKIFKQCDRVEGGSTLLPTKNGLKASTMLVLRGSRGAMAMRVNPRGPTFFAAQTQYPIPSIWVTGPTRETPATTFLLNADFSLDTGRAALPHGQGAEHNLQVATTLATELVEVVRDAVKASCNHWETTQSRLGLVADLTAAEFWAGFWRVLHDNASEDGAAESTRLLHHFSKTLFANYTAFAKEIPNGLPGKASGFVELDKITLALDNRWLKALPLLTNWTALTQQFSVVGWIAADMASALEKHTPRLPQSTARQEVIPRLDVSSLLDVLENGQCPATSAEHLMAILSGVEMTVDEEWALKDKLATLRFHAADGSWQVASRLLKNETDPLEQWCLQFGPDSSRLAVEYTGPARQFVLRYGLPWNALPDHIAQWIIHALDVQPRKAALAYLLRGSYDCRIYVKRGMSGSWLESLSLDSPYLADWDDASKIELVALLNPALLGHAPIALPPVWPVPQSLVGSDALEAIWDWWQHDAARQTERYDHHFWPAGVIRSFEGVAEDRRAWMTLFCLGLMQRHGRTRDYQNRGFIDFLISRGWWEIFCTVRPQDDPAAWFNVLKEYGEAQFDIERYALWMDNFPRLYRVAQWLDVYAHIFLSLDYRHPAETASYLSPRTDAILSGSGIDAPTLRSSLHVGQHIVVRELLRANKLHSPAAQQLAYLPAQRVKRLFEKMGYAEINTSGDIFSVLHQTLGERASFGGAYDIPLLALAGDPDLQVQVLQLANEDSEIEDEDQDERDDFERDNEPVY